jgi:hypothetical protein
MKTKNTLYLFAAAASMALSMSSCKEKTEETTTTTTNDTIVTPDNRNDMDLDEADTSKVNPDTVMGP